MQSAVMSQLTRLGARLRNSQRNQSSEWRLQWRMCYSDETAASEPSIHALLAGQSKAAASSTVFAAPCGLESYVGRRDVPPVLVCFSEALKHFRLYAIRLSRPRTRVRKTR
ncbi:unnamed protein product [Polarella glacialis]|uniref:Uncharacterized protein n=1 Tax=Polarella glacialis TaxID=89957 RepID=A0A813GNG1_POLGL|nr:unnamed protein product [Polarella glacialis]